MEPALSTNSKDRYRKKPYTPPSKKIEKNKFTKLLLPRITKLKNDSNNNRKALYELLHEIGQKGARLDIVLATLHVHDIMPLLSGKTGPWLAGEVLKRMDENGIKENDLMYLHNSQEIDVIEEHGKKVTAWGKKKRTIKAGVNRSLKLEPLKAGIFPDKYTDGLNKELADTPRKSESILDRYLFIRETSQFPPGNKTDSLYRTSLNRPRKQKTQNRKQRDLLQFSNKIIVLVNELTNIGYPYNLPYTLTANLLKLSYPPYYNNDNPYLVKKTYTYHTRKQK